MTDKQTSFEEQINSLSLGNRYSAEYRNGYMYCKSDAAQIARKADTALAAERARVEELENYIRKIDTCIPAYEPPPCDCCKITEKDGKEAYSFDCYCECIGETLASSRWCERMKIADDFERLLSTTNKAEQHIKR